MELKDRDRIIRELLMSPTMERVAHLANQAPSPFDMAAPSDRKRALAASSVGVIQALDSKRIQVQNPRDLAMLHGLLIAAMEVIHDGRFGSEAVQVGTVQ